MRFSPEKLMTGTTKEEKEARLKAFVSRHLEAHQTSQAQSVKPVYRLLALSADSPAARALQSLAPDLAAAGVTVEIVLARTASSATLEVGECRFVTDVRLRDAHEQLVLDEVTVWTGDCMRRDPGKRDAYENYSEASLETARNALRSFAQIWRAAGPTGSLAAGRKWLGAPQPALFDPAVLGFGEAAPAPALLRH